MEKPDPSALLVGCLKCWHPVWDSIKSSTQGDHKTLQFFSWVQTAPQKTEDPRADRQCSWTLTVTPRPRAQRWSAPSVQQRRNGYTNCGPAAVGHSASERKGALGQAATWINFKHRRRGWGRTERSRSAWLLSCRTFRRRQRQRQKAARQLPGLGRRRQGGHVAWVWASSKEETLWNQNSRTWRTCSVPWMVHFHVASRARWVMSDSLRPHGLYSLQASSILGIFQPRIMEWVAISSRPRDPTHVSCISCAGRRIPYCCTTWEAFVCDVTSPLTRASPPSE